MNAYYEQPGSVPLELDLDQTWKETHADAFAIPVG